MESRTGLVWKYFLKQKYEEIFCNGYITFVLFYCIGSVSALIAFSGEETIWWAAYIFFTIVGISVLRFIIFLLKIFFAWIRENWDRANRRADKEIKRRNIKKGRNGK